MYIFLCAIQVLLIACVAKGFYHMGRSRGIATTNAIWKEYADRNYAFMMQLIVDTNQRIESVTQEQEEKHFEAMEELSKRVGRVSKGRN